MDFSPASKKSKSNEEVSSAEKKAIIKGRKQHQLWKRQNAEKKLAKTQKELQNQAKAPDEDVDSLNKGRNYTVSIAVPGTILSNAQSRLLRAHLAGQIARAASIFQVDEVIVFDDDGITRSNTEGKKEEELLNISDNRKACFQMARILQYLECPQYLRKHLIPLHNDLDNAGILYPLDCPHHLRQNEECPYREGCILSKPPKKGMGSYAFVGLQQDVLINKELQPGIRVTVKFTTTSENKSNKLKGNVVAPHVPRTEGGLYWGYNVRLAHSLGSVFTECPFPGGYDVAIGTSDKGVCVDDLTIPTFKHLLVVFGGLKGLESSLEADEGLKITDPGLLFNYYVNTCPEQGCRTIRTEEAILVTLSILRPIIKTSQSND